MNELSQLFKNINNGDVISLENDKVYNVFQDDCFALTDIYCTNTARKCENPHGSRFAAIYLNGKKDITINGNGATILVHGKMTPLLFNECENISVNNLTIDYFCPTMSEFTVLSNQNGKCTIKINDECLFDIKKNDLIWHGEINSKGKYYWKDSYIGNKRHYKLLDPQTGLFIDFSRKDIKFSNIEDLGNNILSVTLKNKEVYFPVGAVIQTRNIIRDHTGSLFNRCKNLSFDNLRVKFMHGLGMVSQFCENVAFTNCDFTPATGRTAASTADFFQFSGCKGQILIDNVKANGAHDDYVNVHGTHLRIVRKNSRNKTITVRFMHHESWGFQAFDVGDELEFIKWDTLIPYDKAVVKCYERLNDTDIRLHLDRALPETIILGKDVVENATWTPDVHIKNCKFGLTCGRGVLCTTRGEVIIENNTFKNVWGPALLIEDDCNFWFESGYTNKIIFRNNTIDCCCYRKMYPGSPVVRYSPKVMNESSTEFVHGCLVFEGNTVKNSVEGIHLFHLEYLKEAVVRNNTFDADFKIITNVCGEITNNNNIISR